MRSRPQLSDSTQTLMQDAWLRASLAGEEQIRSIHLLMALVDRQSLVPGPSRPPRPIGG